MSKDFYMTFYVLAIYIGCRRDELCALKWDDLIMNGDECILTVSRSRSSVAGKGVVEGSTKNGQARTICISEEMTTVLRCYCYYKMYEAREGGFEMSDYVFTNVYGELIHPDTFSRHFRRLYDENRFPREFHLHTLCHYFVSTMLRNGVDKQTVAERYTQTMFDFSDRDSASA